MSDLEKKDDDIVNFDALDAETGNEGSPDEEQKMKEVLTFLKGKLEPEDYSKFLEDMGIKDEMTNAELFDAIKALLKGKEGDGDGDGDGDGEKGDVSYKDFMKECLGEGKNLKECGEEYKKKYPEPAPKDEEIAEVEDLAKEIAKELAKKKPGDDDDDEEDEKDKTIKDMQKRLKTLEDEKELAGVTSKVDALIKNKHIAPVQRDMVIKLSAKLNDEDQSELLEFFEKTQKFSAHQDVGHLESGRPGASGGPVITPERKRELLTTFGLDGLIEDKADMSKLEWMKRDH